MFSRAGRSLVLQTQKFNRPSADNDRRRLDRLLRGCGLLPRPSGIPAKECPDADRRPRRIAEARREARPRAIKYSIEKLKVSVEDIATAIPEYGGIEKFARAAAKPQEDELNKGQDIENHDDQDDPGEDDKIDEPENNLGRQIQVGFSPKLIKTLEGFRNKTRVKIIGYVRASSDEPLTIEAKKIAKVKAKNKASKKKIAKSKLKRASKEQLESENEWA
jgi:hypothetical protein